MEGSGIEWCDDTFNPWMGCTKVSEACRRCYAEVLVDKRFGRARWGAGEARQRTSEANWRAPRTWNRKAKAAGTRRRVFCASLADVFDAEVDPSWRDDLWTLIRETPNLDWLLLTKRPEEVARSLPEGWGEGWENVWLGVTAETQGRADERLPVLLEVPAAVRFASCEPLLSPLELGAYLGRGLDWVIAGGETGTGARAMEATWVREVRDACVEAGVAFHFKQWGDHDAEGRRVGKSKAGRELDGRTWDEFPR